VAVETRAKRRWLVGLPALTGVSLLLCGCPAPKQAAGQKPKKPPPPVNMVVEVGHGNTAREGRAIPVRVTLNQNDKAIHGRLELDDLRGHRSEMPIELPRQGNKVYTLFASLSQNPGSYNGESAEIRVHDGGRVLVRQTLTPVYTAERTLVISATGDGSGLQFLHSSSPDGLRVSHLSPADLPRQWAGYEPADVVALNGRAWTAMDDEQRRALRMWVETGGRAILCGETTTEWRDPEAAALVGVQPRRIYTESDLDCLRSWGDLPFTASGGKLLTVSGPLYPDTRVVYAQGDHPLVVTRSALTGRVLWLGFDAFRETFRGWEGYETFWTRALKEARSGSNTSPTKPPEEVEDARKAANALPRLPAPPMGAIIAFGVVYALIFGPVNIWILRRLRRTVKSWLFVPSLALGMTVVVLLVGQTWGNARTVLNSISILQASGGGRTAREEMLIGLFSPTNRAFDLLVDDPAPDLQDRGSADPREAMPISLGWPARQADGQSRWEAVPLVLYSTRLLHLGRPRDLGGTIEGRLTAAGAIAGKVINGTNLGLRGAYLSYAGRRQWLGDLPPGGEAMVRGGAWAGSLKEELPDPPVVGQFLENRRFRESVRALWAKGPQELVDGPVKNELWLVAECDEYKSALNVAQVPYSNQAGLVVVKIAR
jgi:hypothetical protein